MRRRRDLWWRRRQLWLPAAVLVLVDLAALGVYRVALSGEEGVQAGRVSERREELAALASRRAEAEALLQRARANRAAIDQLYDQRLGSQARRLTAVMLHVKQLARQAGLSGVEAINYVDRPVEDLPLEQKSIVFTAQGSYQQLRSFINLLELSESFIALEEIRVNDSSQTGNLSLQVQLFTLFAEPLPGDEPERPEA